MKLQVHGQHLRLRIDEAELAILRNGGTLENSTCVGAVAWRHNLHLTDARDPSLDATAGDCVIRVPASLVEAYAARLPCRDGLALTLQPSDGPAIELVLEVDVRDSVRSRGAVRRS